MSTLKYKILPLQLPNVFMAQCVNHVTAFGKHEFESRPEPFFLSLSFFFNFELEIMKVMLLFLFVFFYVRQNFLRLIKKKKSNRVSIKAYKLTAILRYALANLCFLVLKLQTSLQITLARDILPKVQPDVLWSKILFISYN